MALQDVLGTKADGRISQIDMKLKEPMRPLEVVGFLASLSAIWLGIFIEGTIPRHDSLVVTISWQVVVDQFLLPGLVFLCVMGGMLAAGFLLLPESWRR